MSDILRKRAAMPTNPTSRDVNRYGLSVTQPGVTSPGRDNLDITLSTSGSDIAKCDSRNSLASRGSDTFHTARTFEVATERGGRKLMSEEEVSNLVHNALRRARQATGQAPPSSSGSNSPRHRSRQNPLSPRSITASSTITSPRPPTLPFKSSTILLPNEGELQLDTNFPRHRGAQVELPARYNRTTGPDPFDLTHATIADTVSNISVDASDFQPHPLSESPSEDSANDDTKINSVNSSEAIIRRVEEEIANARRAAQEANRRLAGVSASFRFNGMPDSVSKSSTAGSADEPDFRGDDALDDRNLPLRPQPSDGSVGPSLMHNDSGFQGSRYDSIGNVTSHDLDNDDDFCRDLSFPSDKSTEIELSRSIEKVESVYSAPSVHEVASVESVHSVPAVTSAPSLNSSERDDAMLEDALSQLMVNNVVVDEAKEEEETIPIKAESVEETEKEEIEQQDSAPDLIQLESESIDKERYVVPTKTHKSFDEAPSDSSTQPVEERQPAFSKEMKPNTIKPKNYSEFPPEFSAQGNLVMRILAQTEEESRPETRTPETTVHEPPIDEGSCHEVIDLTRVETDGSRSAGEAPEVIETVESKSSVLSVKDSAEYENLGTKPSGLSHNDQSVEFETLGSKPSGLSHKDSAESSQEFPLEYQAPDEEVLTQAPTSTDQEAEDSTMHRSPTPPQVIERTQTIEINEHGIAVSVPTKDHEEDEEDFHDVEESSEAHGRSYEIIEPVSTEASTQVPAEEIQETPTFDIPCRDPILVDENGDVEVLPSRSKEERLAALEALHDQDIVTNETNLGGDSAEDETLPPIASAEDTLTFDNEETGLDEKEVPTRESSEIVDDTVTPSGVQEDLTSVQGDEQIVDHLEQPETIPHTEQDSVDAGTDDAPDADAEPEADAEPDANAWVAPDVVQANSDDDVFADVDTDYGSGTTENEPVKVDTGAESEAPGAQEEVGIIESHDHESDAITHLITNKNETLESEDGLDVIFDEDRTAEIEKSDDNHSQDKNDVIAPGPEVNAKKFWWVSEESTSRGSEVLSKESELEQVESQHVLEPSTGASHDGTLDSVNTSDIRPGESDDATLRQGCESRNKTAELESIDSDKPTVTTQESQADPLPDTNQSKDTSITIPEQVVTSLAIDPSSSHIPSEPDLTAHDTESTSEAHQLVDTHRSSTAAVQVKPTEQDAVPQESATATQRMTKVRFKQRYPVPPLISKPRRAEDISRDNRVAHVGSSPFLSKPKPDLRQLLQAAVGSSLQRRSNACGALKVLTKMKKNQLTLVRTAGFLDALVFAASTKISKQDMESSRDTRTRAVSAICNVSEPKDNREIVFCHPGLVTALIQTVKEDKAEARMEACGALALLAKTPSNREPMAQTANLLDVLAALLKGKKGEMQRNSGYKPSYSADDDDESGNQSFSSNSESSASASIEMESSISNEDDEITLPTVASMRELNKSKLSETNKRAKMNACAALLHISKQCGATPIMCQNELLMNAIVAVSQNTNDPLNSKCLEILCNLSRFPVNNEIMANYPGLVESLVVNGGSSNSLDRVWSLRVLQNLSTHVAGKTVLANRIVLELLSFSMMRDNLDEQMAATATLYNLSTEPGAVVPLTNTKNVVATLVHVAHNPESVSEVRLMACDALATLGLWLQTLAGAGTIPKEIDENVTLPTYVTSGWERWD